LEDLRGSRPGVISGINRLVKQKLLVVVVIVVVVSAAETQKAAYKLGHLGYWHQRADERHDNPPRGNQDLLVVKDKVGIPQVSLGQVHGM